jgi:hypothetical protein
LERITTDAQYKIVIKAAPLSVVVAEILALAPVCMKSIRVFRYKYNTVALVEMGSGIVLSMMLVEILPIVRVLEDS